MLRAWLTKLRKQFFGKVAPIRKTPSKRMRPGLELLEDRRLLAGGLAASLSSDGLLRIYGTHQDDAIIGAEGQGASIGGQGEAS